MLYSDKLKFRNTIIEYPGFPYGTLLFADIVAKNLSNQPFSAAPSDKPHRLGMAIVDTYDSIARCDDASTLDSTYVSCIECRKDVLEGAPFIFQVIDALCVNSIGDAAFAAWIREYCTKAKGTAWRVDQLPPVFALPKPIDADSSGKYPPDIVAGASWWTRCLQIGSILNGENIPEETLISYHENLIEAIMDNFERSSRSVVMGRNGTHLYGPLVTAAKRMRRADEDNILYRFHQILSRAPVAMKISKLADCSLVTVSYGDRRVDHPIPPVTI